MPDRLVSVRCQTLVSDAAPADKRHTTVMELSPVVGSVPFRSVALRCVALRQNRSVVFRERAFN